MERLVDVLSTEEQDTLLHLLGKAVAAAETQIICKDVQDKQNEQNY